MTSFKYVGSDLPPFVGDIGEQIHEETSNERLFVVFKDGACISGPKESFEKVD